MLVETPLAKLPLVSVPVVVAPAQFSALIVAGIEATGMFTVQKFPPETLPTKTEKLAVPEDVGVPVMVNTRDPPVPMDKYCEALAVKPKTPVEVMLVA